MIERGYGRIVNVSSGAGSFAERMESGYAPIYSISKAALNAITLIGAENLPSSIKINAVCPGWVNTEMGGPTAPLTIEEGADSIIWLATLPNSGPTGKFFRCRKEISW